MNNSYIIICSKSSEICVTSAYWHMAFTLSRLHIVSPTCVGLSGATIPISSITHRNDEAYVGALCVVIALKEILNNQWDGSTNLLSIISSQIPDSRVKDRIQQLETLTDLTEIGSYGNSGYVVDSIPLALAAANQIRNLDLDTIFNELIEVGGDTDTNCSIAGQIAGCFVGKSNFSSNLMEKIKSIPEYESLNSTLNKFGAKLKWL